MFRINTKQLSAIRDRYNDLLPDECTLRIRTDAQDSAGQPVASWSDDYTAVPCGFETSPFKFRAREIVAGGEGTSEILVRARLPIAYYTLIRQDDRIVLTKRHGDTLSTPEVYEIQGFLERGPFGLVANLKRVEP
jgi:hypothetical protein